MPTTIFPNYPPGGHIDDENNKKAIEALQSAKEYSIVTEDILQQESILSEWSEWHEEHYYLIKLKTKSFPAF